MISLLHLLFPEYKSHVSIEGNLKNIQKHKEESKNCMWAQYSDVFTENDLMYLPCSVYFLVVLFLPVNVYIHKTHWFVTF